MERITWNKVNDIFLNKLLRRPFLLQNSLFLTVPPCISDRSSGARATSFPGLYFSLAPGGGKKRDPGNEADAGANQRTRTRNQRTRAINPSSYSAEPFPGTNPGGKPWNRDESDLFSVARFHSNECESEIQLDIV